MILADNVNVRRSWEECPRDAFQGQWEAMYASMNAAGQIMLGRTAYKALGEPEAVLLLYDRERHVVGLQPTNPLVEKNAYPVRPRGKCGGRRVFAWRMMREFGLQVYETVRFHRCQLDNNGVLILDLKDTRPVVKKRRHN